MNPNPALRSPFDAQAEQQAADVEPALAAPSPEVPALAAAPVPPAPVAAPVAAPAVVAPAPKSDNLTPPDDLKGVFEGSAKAFDVPVNVLMALAHQESRYNPLSVNTSSGAQGIMNYMPATAKGLGINPFDPNEAIPAAAKQLRERLDAGESMAEAVKGHFAGPDRKLWGPKTAAYGDEVLAKAGAIGEQLYAPGADNADDTAPAPEPAKQNAFSPKMSRDDYMNNFVALNPQATPDALKAAMAQYDTGAAARTKASGNRVQDKFAQMASPEAAFNAKLDAKLQAGNKGVAQALPGAPMPAAPAQPPASTFDTIAGNLTGGTMAGLAGAGAAGASMLGADATAKELDDTRAAIEARMQELGGNTIVGKASALVGGVAPALAAPAEMLPQLLVNAGIFALPAARDTYNAQITKGASQKLAIVHAAEAAGINMAMPSVAAHGFGALAGKLGTDAMMGLKGAAAGVGQAAAEGVGFSAANSVLDKGTDVLAGQKNDAPWIDPHDMAAQALGFGALRAGHRIASGDPVHAQIAAEIDAGHIADPAGAQAEAVARLNPQNYDPATISPAETVNPARAAAPVAAPAVAAPSGPLEAAVHSAAPAEGETFSIPSDDGTVATFHADANGDLVPAAPAPLTDALHTAAAEHAVNPHPVPEIPQAPAAPPEPPAIESFSTDELHDQLKAVAAAIKENRTAELVAQRKVIEKEIGQRAKEARDATRKAADEAQITMGPFDNIGEANRMALRAAEATQTPHEVIEKDGKFTLKPAKEDGNGKSDAVAAAQPDGAGSGATAVRPGAADRAKPDGPGPVPVVERADAAGNDGAANADPVRANPAADAKPALNKPVADMSDAQLHDRLRYINAQAKSAGWTKMHTNARDEVKAEIAKRAAMAEQTSGAPVEPGKPDTEWKTNQYAARSFADADLAAKFMDKHAVDGSKFEAVQVGPVKWKLQPKAEAPAVADLTGEKIDKEWHAFAADSGTLNVDRAEMPQVKAEHRGALTQFLLARGIPHEQLEMPAGDLKPTQREFSPAKVEKARNFEGGDRSILVSSDNHVLDGHHQWLAKLDGNEPVRVIKLDAPIKTLLDQVKEFPSAEVRDGATAAEPAAAPAKDERASEAFATEPEARTYLKQNKLAGTHAVKQVAADRFEVQPKPQDGAGAAKRDEAAAKHAKQEEAVRQAAENIAKRKEKADQVDAAEKKQPPKDDALTQESAAPVAPISDFGEKLEGARKDLWSSYKQAMESDLPADIKDITLSKHFPEPNYEAMIAAGADVKALAAVKAMRDEIPAKPRVPYKLRQWAEKVTTIRELSANLLSGKMPMDKLMHELRVAKGSSLGKFADRIEMYADLGYPLFTKAANFKIEAGDYGMFESKEYKPPIRKYALERDGRTLGYFDSHEQAVDNLRTRLEAEQPESKGSAVKLDLYRLTGSRDVIIGKKVGPGKFIDLKGGFAGPREAREYLAAHQDELAALLEQKKNVRPERRSVNSPRVGIDRRMGEDITPEKFGTTFGFRGVQFGNYVEQKRRAADLNNAYDALTDMVDLIGVPPKALSLNGTLGLAFGARGAGGKMAPAAHYEPGKIVINLTKTNGAGSLAHEWFHGLDNYFERARGAAGEGHVTDNPNVRMKPDANRKFVADDSVRPEVLAAVKGVMDAIKQSGMVARSKELDMRRSKNYWSTNHELAARAFESYIIDKAEGKGLSNDYLANILGEDAHNALNESTGLAEPFPYPLATEKPAINAAFDKLFDTLKTRENSNNVELFDAAHEKARTLMTDGPLSRMEEPKRVMVLSELKRLQKLRMANKMTDEMYRASVDSLIGRIGERNDVREANKAKDFERGPAWVEERLMRAKRTQELNPDTVDFALWALRKSPSLAHDLAISIRSTGKDGTAGSYRSADRIISLFKGSANEGTAVHEMLHHTERMMPAAIQKGIAKAWISAYTDAWMKADAKTRVLLDDLMQAGLGDQQAFSRTVDAFGKGKLDYTKHYQLVNASEFWAVNATRIMAGRYDAATKGWGAKAKQWLAEMVQHVKGSLGLKSDAPILKGLAEVLNGTGEQQSSKMLGQIPVASDIAKQTESPAFKRWFGKSKMTEDGKPLVLYHGTGRDFSQFTWDRWPSTINAIGAWFASDAGTASKFTGRDGHVMPVYLRVEKPLYVDSFEELQGLWKQHAGGDEKLRNGNPEALREWLRSQGYDGLSMSGSDLDGFADGIYVVPLDATQIKSATGNNGNFDPSDNFITHDITAGAAPRDEVAAAPEDDGLTPPEQGLLRRGQAAIQDNLNRVKQVQERIAAVSGTPVRPEADYYGAETNRPGRIAARLEDMQDHLTGPMMERLGKSGNTPEQLNELLHAMHAHERNEAVAKINPEFPDGGSGMTDAEAQKVLAKYKGNAELHEMAQQARDIAGATLDLKKAYGLISDDQHELLAKMYENYVPLKGDGEFGPKIKRAMGHDAREEFIIDNIARDYAQAVTVGEKNLARQSLLQMVLRHPDEELWTARVPPKGRYVAGTVMTVKRGDKIVANFASKDQVSAFLEAKGPEAGQYTVETSAGERVAEFTKPLQDNEVMVYVKGQPVRLQIHDDKLARQLRPLDAGQMNAAMEFLRGANRHLARVYTGYNPYFIPRNMARDALTGTINMVGNEGADIAAKAWGHYPAAFATLVKWAHTKAIPDGQMGKYLDEYRQQGGKVGASWMSDLEQQGKSLQAMYDDAAGLARTAATGSARRAAAVAWRKTVGKLAHVIEVVNQGAENALRLSLFTALRKAGQTPAQAARAAKSVTVNFDRKGTATPALGALYLFLNPAIQGTANMGATLSGGKHKYQAWAAVGGLAALGYLLAARGMDDDRDRWLGTGWDERTKNFMLKVGEHQVKIPMSQEYAPFFAAGAAMAEASRGETKMKSAARLFSSFVDAYFPLNGAFRPDSDNHGLDLRMAVMPTIAKPFDEIWSNRSSFGSALYPETEQTKDRPDNLKMNRSTKNTPYDKASQAIAAAGQAMGSRPYENDISKVSPETLKLLWRTYTGGLGGFIADSVGFAGMAFDDASQMDSGDTPFVKDFWRPNDIRPVQGRFYDLERETKAVITEFKQAAKAGDAAAAQKLATDPDSARVLGLTSMIGQLNKAAGQLSDQAIDVNADKSLTGAEKRAKLKAIDAQREQLYRAGIAAFKN